LEIQVFSKTKSALGAVLILGAASAAALANDIETAPSEAQSSREWAAYLGHTRSHKHENVFVSNTYDSSDWAPVYAGASTRHEPKAGTREKGTDRYARGPSWQPSLTTDRLR
jgi:hypothetical protein